jgi:hypothetical protein
MNYLSPLSYVQARWRTAKDEIFCAVVIAVHAHYKVQLENYAGN